MWNVFKGNDIVLFAVTLEENGARFYHALAEKTKDQAVKELMQELEKQEWVHHKIYGDILKELPPINPMETYSGEYLEYVQSLVDGHVFNISDPKKLAEELDSEQKALEMALRIEKDSVLFFNELQKIVPKTYYDTVEKIISEEQSHVRRISQMLEERKKNA